MSHPRQAFGDAEAGVSDPRMALTTEKTTTEKATSKKATTERTTARRPPRVRPFAPAPAEELAPPRGRSRVRDLGLTSVAKVSACFYLCGFVVILVAATVLWMVATAVGVVGEIESFMDDLGFEGFHFISGTLLWAALLIGFALTAILTVITVVAAALYNLFADLVGGFEVTLTPVVEEPDEPDDEPVATPVERNGNGRGNGNGVRHR